MGAGKIGIVVYVLALWSWYLNYGELEYDNVELIRGQIHVIKVIQRSNGRKHNHIM